MSKKIGITTIGLTVVTEQIRAVIFKTVTPLAVEQSIVEDAPHNDRLWVFYGLEESSNYIFKIQKNVATVWVDVPGYYFTFTPDNPAVKYKEPVQIHADYTTGFVSGVNSVVFDGTDGKDDWRGFKIFPDRGAGLMKRDIDYSWDDVSGTWALLQEGDLFQPGEYWDIEFATIIAELGGGQVLSGKLFNETVVITEDYAMTDANFGKNNLIQGEDEYLEVTLPDIATIPENKMAYIESGSGAHLCARFKTFSGAQKIDWLEGNLVDLFFCRNEQLAIYPLNGKWRIKFPEGGFKNVGRDFHSFSDLNEEANAIPLNGGGNDGLSVTAYARLYNRVVLRLNPSKVCTYADWSTGNNKYKFSFANDEGFFHIPDTRDMFVRNTGNARDVGIYQADQIKQTEINLRIRKSNNNYGFGTLNGPIIDNSTPANNEKVTIGTGTETSPVNISFNHFIYT
ncbi:MAG: hypothetical protein V4450_07475 [Bacteroidota bacterium]